MDKSSNMFKGRNSQLASHLFSIKTNFAFSSLVPFLPFIEGGKNYKLFSKGFKKLKN